LLEAQVEALFKRLVYTGSAEPAEELSLMSRRLTGLKAEPVLDRRRSLAGVEMMCLKLTITGRPDLLLAYLEKTRQTGMLATPPMEAVQSGMQVRLRLNLWSVTGTRVDNRAANQAMIKLRDNLIWFEDQKKKFPPTIAVIQAIIEAETAGPSSAVWDKGTLLVSGRANDQVSADIFEKELRSRAAKIPGPPRVEFNNWIHGTPPKNRGHGLDMLDADPADVLLMLGQLSKANLIFAGPNLDRVSGSIRGDSGDKLLDRFFEKLGLAPRQCGDITVASALLRPNPPDTSMFPETPVSLHYRKVSAQPLFSLLADISRMGLIPPPPSEVSLTVLLRAQSLRQIAAATFWALGLEPQGTRKLLAALPAGSRPVERKTSSDEAVDLYAAGAPLTRLVGVLANAEQVLACSVDDTRISFRLRQVPRKRLLQLLLASHGARTIEADRHTFLVPARSTTDKVALEACKKSQAGVPPVQRRWLAAVIRGKDATRALVMDGGKFRWRALGESLADGSRVRRIYSGRLLLKTTSGKLDSLLLGPPEEATGPGADYSLKPDTLGTALSRLRLAATAVLKDRALALLLDREGNAFVVRKGHPLGRRCASVTGILPGTITLTLGCPRPFDAGKTRLFLTRQIDSESQDR
jgi:hypothetical protein